MKNFALACGVAALMAGFYTWGSTPARHSVKNDKLNICNRYVSDTVPKKKDSMSRQLPKDTTKLPIDTTKRKDTL